MKICETEYCNNEVYKNNRCYWCDLAYRAYEKHDQQALYAIIIFMPHIVFKSNTSCAEQKRLTYEMFKRQYPCMLPYFEKYATNIKPFQQKTVVVKHSKEIIKMVRKARELYYRKEDIWS